MLNPPKRNQPSGAPAPAPDKVQRLRLTFARDESARYITHLDVMRMWERVLKRARLPLAYSEGFTPRPKIAIAAPLAVGMTSECELLEITLVERLPLRDVLESLPPQLPIGLRLLDVQEVALGLPSLQSMVRAASYLVDVPDHRDADAWAAAIAALLAKDSIPWQHMRGDDLREYDLRPLVIDLALVTADAGTATLRMHLRNDSAGSGRAEQVTRALGATEDPARIHRTGIGLEEPQIARAAYRNARRPDESGG